MTIKLSRVCYTYLMTFTHPVTGRVLKYYGSRVKQGCRPDEIGVSYKSSSRHVKKLVDEFPPSCFTWKVDDTFGEDIWSCLDYESQMIRFVGAVRSPDWLNRHDGHHSWNHGGLRHTEETRRVMSEKARTRKRQPHSEESKHKIAEAARRRRGHKFPKSAITKSKPFAFYDPDGNLHTGFGVKQFSLQHGLNQSNMNNMRRGLAKSINGWTKAPDHLLPSIP